MQNFSLKHMPWPSHLHHWTG